jgi:hypothetical protein
VLAQIALNYPGRVAAIEMHVRSGYEGYCYEARQRMYYYPPPYYSGGSWYYVTPWLWYDGDKHGGYQYSTWQSKIVSRMNQPAPVTITMWGSYTPSDGTGTIYAQFRNDSTATTNGRVLIVITEDSLYYTNAPNGDYWHNHVARDYVPDQNGQMVSIPAGDSVTVSQPFTIQAGWNEDKCDIVTWIQNDVMQTDSTKEIWQGGYTKVTDLIGIEEENFDVIATKELSVTPNPCVNGTEFAFALPVGSEYKIDIYDVLGRRVRTLEGVSSSDQESVTWSCMNDIGSRVATGVYLYRFESELLKTTGKIVVR